MAASFYVILSLGLLGLLCVTFAARIRSDVFTNFINSNRNDLELGTRWAVLIAGSSGWKEYDDQADVCHAYQILLKGGLKKENIVVLMYDDIASNPINPRPNKIINSFGGPDVYSGVQVDYSGEAVTWKSFMCVLAGLPGCVIGGNGRVIKSGRYDHIFVYYSGHGNTQKISMPTKKDPLSAYWLHRFLNYMHFYEKYADIVIYIQACKSGSMFEDFNMENAMNIYAVTSANATEMSHRTNCPRDVSPPREFNVCLGTQFGVSWMEDWERYSTATDIRTLNEQYEEVRDRVSLMKPFSSHVSQYGDKEVIGLYDLETYMGRIYRPFGPIDDHNHDDDESSLPSCADGELVLLRNIMKTSPPGSQEYVEAKKELEDILATMKHEDENFARIQKVLEKKKNSIEMKNHRGKMPHDDDNTARIEKVILSIINKTVEEVQYAFDDCNVSLWCIYSKHCGGLSKYGFKHTDDFRDMCDAGVTEYEMTVASIEACST